MVIEVGTPVCPGCGAPLPPEAGLGGLCPRCLFGLAADEAPTLGYEESDADGEEQTFSPGQLLGDRYRIGSLLGRGGMGEVWRAYDLKLRLEVALKSLHPRLFETEEALELLRDEVRTAREVTSPNVSRLYDLIEIGDQELVSMEYVDGITLHEHLQQHGPLQLKEANEIASQLLAGLETVHDAGLVHRDIKPENVMLTRASRVVIMDFGLTSTSGSGSIGGTPAYMPPEQARGEPTDARADVYSAGIVLAEMLSAERGPDESSRQNFWRQMRRDPPVLPESPWKQILARAVSFDAEQRYASAAELARALEEVAFRVEGVEVEHPYPGLASFQEEDAELFFGREAEVEATWKRLQRSYLMGLIGPSGSGKSSFINAGLLPAAPEGWFCIRMSPGTNPFVSLGRALQVEFATDSEALRLMSSPEGPDPVLEILKQQRSNHGELLIVVDQFEELFTQNPVEVQRRFAEILGRAALEAEVRVLLSMRDDYLFQCQPLECLRPMFSELTPLGLPTSSALRRAIVQPALRCGYRFEDETVVEEMLAEVEGRRGALPLLAFAVAQLWERRDRQSGLLSQQSYNQIGGVGGALAQHAEAILDYIGEANEPIVRELFRNLVTAQGTRVAREREELLSVFSKTEGQPFLELSQVQATPIPLPQRHAPLQVLNSLIDARLLTSFETPAAQQGAEPIQHVEIVHESLLANWPRLVRWQMQDAEGAKLRDEIRSQARLWEEHGRSEDYLWTGAAFKEYELWRERYPGGLAETERAFCQAMVAHARKQKRLYRIAVAASFGILLTMLGVVTTLWRQGEAARREAVAEARRAEASQLMALAHLEVDQYPTAALAYALSSLELADELTARLFAIEVLWRGPTAFVLDDHFCWNAQFSPDGRWLASGGTRGRLAVWPSVGGRAIALRGHEGHVVPIGFTSDSTHLVTQGKRAEETLRVWSLEPHQLTKTWTVDRVSEWAAFFDSTQQRVLTYEINAESSRTNVRSWPIFEGEPRLLETVPRPIYWNAWCSDPTTGRIGFSPFASGVVHVASLSQAALGSAPTLGQHELPVVRCAFQAGGRRIATIDESGSVDIWLPESTNGHPERVLTTPGNVSARSIALSPEGSLLAVGSTDQILRIWDLSATPAADALDLRRGDVGFITGLGFDPSGRWLAAGTSTGTAIWPVSGSFSHILSGHTDLPAALEFTTDGSYLLSASYDGSIRRWPLGPEVSGQAVTLFQDPSGIELLKLDPKGGRAVFSTSDGGPILTSFDDQSVTWMGGMGFSFSALAFDSGGRWVAAGGGAIEPADALIRLWDVDSPEPRFDEFHEMPVMDYSLTLDAGDGEEISDLAFAPGGWLFSAGTGGLRRWSVVEKSFEQIRDEPVLRLAISSDERWLLGITGDRRLATGGRILRLDLQDFTVEYLDAHGGEVLSMALSTEADILVTGDSNGIVRVGRPDGLQPHLLLGHTGPIRAVAVSSDRRWIASGSDDNTLRLWPMPDLDQPPLHTLPRDELIAKLRSLTNLVAVRDPESSTGWSIEIGPFPGWEEVPTW